MKKTVNRVWSFKVVAILSACLFILAVLPPAAGQAAATEQEFRMAGAYTMVIASDWEDRTIYSGPHEVTAGVVAQPLKTEKDGAVFVAMLDAPQTIHRVVLKGSFAPSFKVQYRDRNTENPTGFTNGEWDYSGLAGYGENDANTLDIDKDVDGDTMTVTLAAPVETQALLFQGNGFNITEIHVYGEPLPYWYENPEAPKFILRTEAELLDFAAKANADANLFAGKRVVLDRDMDMKGRAWTPPANFKGIFDGNGYAVTGLTVTNTGDTGLLFGTLSGDAVVMNLLLDGSVTSTAGVAAGFCLRLEENAAVVNCMNRASVSGSPRASGIAENMAATATVANTVSTGSITSISTGQDYFGAFGTVGYGSVERVYTSYSIHDPVVNTAYGAPKDCAVKTDGQMKDAAFAALLNSNRAAAAALVTGLEPDVLIPWVAVDGQYPAFDPAFVGRASLPLAIGNSESALPSAAAGSPFTFTVEAAGGDPAYTFAANGLPDGLSIHASTGVISGTPAEGGSFEVTVTVTDALGNTASAGWTLAVSGGSVSIGAVEDITIKCGDTLSLKLPVTGPASTALASANKPQGATLTADYVFLWPTKEADRGAHDVTFTATAPDGSAYTRTIHIDVVDRGMAGEVYPSGIYSGFFANGNWEDIRLNRATTLAGGVPARPIETEGMGSYIGVTFDDMAMVRTVVLKGSFPASRKLQTRSAAVPNPESPAGWGAIQNMKQAFATFDVSEDTMTVRLTSAAAVNAFLLQTDGTEPGAWRIDEIHVYSTAAVEPDTDYKTIFVNMSDPNAGGDVPGGSEDNEGGGSEPGDDMEPGGNVETGVAFPALAALLIPAAGITALAFARRKAACR